MCGIFSRINSHGRIRLLMESVNRTIVQYLRQPHRKPFRNHYLYSDRYKYIGLQQYGNCYGFCKSFTNNWGKLRCGYMCRLLCGINCHGRVFLYVESVDRSFVQHLRQHYSNSRGNNHLHSNGYECFGLQQQRNGNSHCKFTARNRC
jgi:hypothetical protein